MAQKRKPVGLPLAHEIGGRIGHGQDNNVYDLLASAEKSHLRKSVGFVAKVSNKLGDHDPKIRNRSVDPKVAAERGIHYKKNKYEILKHFLGDIIPESHFVLAQENHSGGKRPVELTIQEKVPQVKFSDLTPEERKDPRLHENTLQLVNKLQYMYKVIGEVNARTSSGIDLDAKLDLGGVSDFVRSEQLDHIFTDNEVEAVIEDNKSPNILINPETMQVYCIDFDQGEWSEGMDGAKALAFEIDARNKVAKLGQVAFRGAPFNPMQSELPFHP